MSNPLPFKRVNPFAVQFENTNQIHVIAGLNVLGQNSNGLDPKSSADWWEREENVNQRDPIVINHQITNNVSNLQIQLWFSANNFATKSMHLAKQST